MLNFVPLHQDAENRILTPDRRRTRRRHIEKVQRPRGSFNAPPFSRCMIDDRLQSTALLQEEQEFLETK